MGEKKFLYYIFIVTTLAVALIAYFLTYPLTQKVDTSKKDFQNKKGELTQLQKREKTLRDLESSYKNFQDKIDMLNKMIPEVKDVSDYLTQLETAANRTGVVYKSIKVTGQTQQQTQQQPQQSESDKSGKNDPSQSSQVKELSPKLNQLTKVGDMYELPIEIIIITNDNQYQNIVSFVETTEKLSRFTSIKKVSTKIDENEHTLETTIVISIYVLP